MQVIEGYNAFMNDSIVPVKQLKEELARLPKGYISRKMINGKERFYLQWREDGRM